MIYQMQVLEVQQTLGKSERGRQALATLQNAALNEPARNGGETRPVPIVDHDDNRQYQVELSAARQFTQIQRERDEAREMAAAPKPIKLPSRQEERDNAIVQAAIAATSKQAASASRKRSHSTHAKDSPPSEVLGAALAKKLNAFSKMMAASKKREEWVPAAADLSPWAHVFEKTLDKLVAYENHQCMSEYRWACAVSESLVHSVECQIIPTVFPGSATQRKLDALHALIEMATAIAYAPKSVASEFVRTGRVPAVLISGIFKIVELMSDLDIKRVISEKAFVAKVRELRHKPKILWEGDTWIELGDLLRIFRDPGPIDFRRVHRKIEENMTDDYDRRKGSKWVMIQIQSDVLSYLTVDTCFETRYNAMNILVDVATLMQK